MRTSLIKLASAFVLAGSLCSAQPAKRPMTFEDMMAMKRLGETAVSPDGKWLAYSVTAVDLAQNTRTTEWRLQKIEGGDPLKLAVAQAGDSGDREHDAAMDLYLTLLDAAKNAQYQMVQASSLFGEDKEYQMALQNLTEALGY